MFYQLGWERKMERIGKDGEMWFIHGVTFVKSTLMSSSFCFVALVVLLRLLAVTKPLETETLHQKIGCIGSIICWVVPFLANLLPPILCLTFLNAKTTEIIAYLTVFIVTECVPLF